ncbi:MAG: hypothetical protein GXX08_04075 [Firmicutes bacterium]|nr:hypothetical protein [Bacillota bacterium]
MGKSEVAMNLAALRARADGMTRLVDLDVVNPYFRSRESRSLLHKLGVHVISSVEGLEMADLPALSPSIRGAIEGPAPVVIDVGGDQAGARALGRFRRVLDTRPFDFLLVTNYNRPLCTTAESAVRLAREIEAVARLKFTGIVSNTHMASDTRSEDVQRGLELSYATAGLLGIPVVIVAISEDCFARGVRAPSEWNGSVVLLRRFNDPDRVLSQEAEHSYLWEDDDSNGHSQ